jgi:FkbM family methyltransferase
MLISLSEVLSKYNMKPKGVIHVGAHWAEEHDDYVANGIERFVYVEPCKDAHHTMLKRLAEKHGNEGWYGALNPYNGNDGRVHIGFEKDGINISLFQYACGSTPSQMVMYVSHNNQGQSNSLLEPDLHLQQHKEVVFNDAELVEVVTLDSLKVTGDMLVMDCQGFEGEVLKGGIDTLKQVNIIYTEVNNGSTYKGNMLIQDVDDFLAQYRFKRVETYWPSPNWTWGDAVYIKEGLL